MTKKRVGQEKKTKRGESKRKPTHWEPFGENKNHVTNYMITQKNKTTNTIFQ